MTHPDRPPCRRLPPVARLALLALLSAAAVVACSGSGGGGPTAPGVRTVGEVEAASFNLLNSARGGAGLAPLAFEPGLSAIARAHSEAMRDAGFFGHVDPQGRGFTDRLRDAGQPFSAAGENLAQVTNAGDPAAPAHDRLMMSGEHRAAILDPRFQFVGVGAARSGETFWITQLFVRR